MKVKYKEFLNLYHFALSRLLPSSTGMNKYELSETKMIFWAKRNKCVKMKGKKNPLKMKRFSPKLDVGEMESACYFPFQSSSLLSST